MNKLFGFVFACVLTTSLSYGALISYDFSAMGFTDGQSLEGMTLNDATFTSETHDLRYYSAYGEGIGTGYGWGAAGDTYIDFSTAVDQLSFRAGDGSGDNDAFAVTAYEFGTGNLLGTWSSPVFGGAAEPEWYTLAVNAANIGRIEFDPGNGGVLPGVASRQGGVVITDMSYNTQAASVPEPSFLILLAMGLAALGMVRKKEA